MSNKKEPKMDLAGDLGTAIFDLFAILMEKLLSGLSLLCVWLWRKYIVGGNSSAIKKIERADLKKTKETKEYESIGYSITRKKDIKGEELDKRKHTLICGASGFGKTVLLDALMYDDLRADKPVIFIDPKGDNQSLLQFINLCRFCERDFQVFSEYYEGPGQIALNPVKEGSATTIADRMHYSFDWSDEHYETLCYTALKKACELVISDKITPSYKNILNKIIEISCPYDKKKLFIRKDIEGIIMRLSNLIQSDFGERLEEDGLSMDEIWKSKKCVYIGLSVLGYPKIARAIGRAVLNDLSYAVYNSYRHLTFDNDEEFSPVGVYIDELSAVVSDQFIELLNKCRGAKMELTFAFQSPSDITKINPHLTQQVLENSSNWFILKQRMEAGSNLFSESIGTDEGTKETVRIKDGERQDIGSQRDVQELLVHSNIIKNLKQGQAVLLQHNPTNVELINIKYIDPEIAQHNVKVLENDGFIPKIFEDFKKQKIVNVPPTKIAAKTNKKLSAMDKKILEAVGSWKVIFIKDLARLPDVTQSYDSLCEKVRTLEGHGYLRGNLKKRTGKHITLTEKGFSSIGLQNFDLVVNPDHDLLCTRVIMDLLATGFFLSGRVPKSGEYEMDPDGVLSFKKKPDVFTVAVEVELTQKSKSRIVEKFKKYAKEKFAKALYVFNNKQIFNSYQKILKEQDECVRDKIILTIDENLSINSYSPASTGLSHFKKKTKNNPSKL